MLDREARQLGVYDSIVWAKCKGQTQKWKLARKWKREYATVFGFQALILKFQH